MAIAISGIPRKFKAKIRGKEIILDDPNPELLPDQVRILYTDTYADLSSAQVFGPHISEECVMYEFEGKLGTKG